MEKYAVIVGKSSVESDRVAGCLGLRGFKILNVQAGDAGSDYAGGRVKVVVFMPDVPRGEIRRLASAAKGSSAGVKVVVVVGDGGVSPEEAAEFGELVDLWGNLPLDLGDLLAMVGKNILLVDDNRAFVLPMATLLRGKGFNVIDVLSLSEGRKAVERYGRFLDVCLLDYDLDGEFSTDLAKELRAVNGKCFVVMMTGGHYADVGFEDLLTDGTINMFVKKPFMARELVDALYKAVGLP
jgi:CheY-like chemotaxis protein